MTVTVRRVWSDLYRKVHGCIKNALRLLQADDYSFLRWWQNRLLSRLDIISHKGNVSVHD